MRIALIAMSGIRVCDQDLVRLGLTLPGFVERSKVIASLPSLGLLILAGLTPAKHEISYFEIPDIREMKSLPDGFDLVAISSYSAQIDEAYDLALRYKKLGTTIILGGPHVTVLPEEAAAFCTSVVIGEGEVVWRKLLEDCEKGTLAQRYGNRDGDYDLAASPLPAFELLDINKYNRLTVQTSRGCPHLCEFCASSTILTPRYKQKPIARVLEEIDAILRVWKHPFLEFADDNAMVNHAYWRELAKQLIRRKTRWFAETDISVSEDEELLTLLRESGCAQLLIGFESPKREGLSGIELHNDWKFKRYDYYRQAIPTIQSHGISVNGCFVIGLDGHTTDIFDEVYEFVRATGLHEVQVTIQTPFPGTPLYDRLQKEGRMLEPTNWKKCTLFDVNYRPDQMSAEQLTLGFRSLIAKLYSDEFTKLRNDNFRKNLRKSLQRRGES